MIVRGSETVLVQGITGKQGTFWSERMRDYGTRIVGGVNPKRAGEAHLGLPVWTTAVDAARATKIDAAVMFIPPFGVKAAALDAIAAGIGKIVCLTEHVPVQDTMYALSAARERGTCFAASRAGDPSTDTRAAIFNGAQAVISGAAIRCARNGSAAYPPGRSCAARGRHVAASPGRARIAQSVSAFEVAAARCIAPACPGRGMERQSHHGRQRLTG
ncbi:MAG: hypothetical protein HC872_09720 [Gammaproteobacteria bacterium]|nr:hypothetical protein [Gammaproteobacteria bacterium]